MTETFPDIEPDHPITKQVGVDRVETRLGDGYRSNVRFGLNPRTQEWRVPWKYLTIAQRDEIETFLEARAIDGDPFLWTPPYASGPQQFRVENWSPARNTPAGSALELLFKRVYEVE